MKEYRKKIAVLGSTGSIGTQTLDVVRANGDLEVEALSAGSNIDLLEQQIREFRPKLAAVYQEEKAVQLRERLRDMDVRVVSGMDGLLELAVMPETEQDTVGAERSMLFRVTVVETVMVPIDTPE